MMLDDVTNERTVTATATTVVELTDVTRSTVDAPDLGVTENATNAAKTPHVDPEALGTSYRDQAETALAVRDLAAAEQHYLAWLHADPTDASSWYNLACVQSLRGEREAALLSFRASLSAGFDQLEHATRDSDLAAIRDDPRFGEALEAAVARAAERDLDGMERRVVLTETIGTYVALLPPDYAAEPEHSYPLCVLLHGSGSDEISHARVAKPMGREGVIYIAPRALQAHVGATIARKQAGWTVWTPDDMSDDTGIHPMSVHVEWIFRCIDDAMARYRIQNNRVAIWGHSQGAASAVCCAALHPDRVTTICAFAGFYPELEVTDERVATMVAQGVKVRLGHARDDGVVDPTGTEEFETRLREARAEFEVRWFESGGHALSPDVIDWSRLWLRAFVDGAR